MKCRYYYENNILNYLTGCDNRYYVAIAPPLNIKEMTHVHIHRENVEDIGNSLKRYKIMIILTIFSNQSWPDFVKNGIRFCKPSY